MDNDIGDDGGLVSSANTVALLASSEIDQQIATAHKYPRSVAKFRKNVQEMVTLSDSIAAECIYSLPRDGKVVEGPSARFAEVVASAWGNSRAGARVVSDAGDFVTAQGVFHDLERNVAITYEVQRRIVDKGGRRYKPDMIGVTANAACSIALRNAILKGVPKAFWAEMYEGAKQMAKGDVQTLPNRRAAVLKDLLGYGIKPEQVYAKFGLQGMADIGLDLLATLRGLVTAIKEGDTTPEQAFDTAPAGDKPAVPRKTDAPPPADAPVPAHGPTVATPEGDRGPSGPTLGDAARAIGSINGHSPVDVLKAAVSAAGAEDLFEETGELASGGERQLILSRVKAKRADLIGTLDACGVTKLNDPMTLDGLTKAQFHKLKAHLGG
jgi:hypothetical protein